MKIKLICLEDGIISYGFRKMVSYIEASYADAHCYYVSTNLNRSMWSLIFSTYGGSASAEDIDAIATELSDADVVGFSSMSGYATLTKSIVSRLREKTRHPYIVWGGIHPIINPEDAIQSDVDAICTGEGQFAFHELLQAMEAGKDFRTTRNFWFKQHDNIIKNAFRPLMTNAEMETLPFPKYGGEERIYKPMKGFVPTTHADYLNSNGLAYQTVWTIGCPFNCAYCGNSKFLDNDKNYRKLRYPSPRYLIDEVKQARATHPWISSISFHDDSFMALPLDTISEFARMWREEIGLPFAVYGLIPNYARDDKVEVLTRAGMNRIRMGIQSGSQRILEFYRRPSSIEKIEKAAAILARYKKYHIPPTYDIIVDNPIETRQDIVDTLELLYRLPRPYFLLMFSLKIIPNTELERLFQEQGVELDTIDKYYGVLAPTFANLLFYVLTFFKPPRQLFERLLEKVRGVREPQPPYRFLTFVMRLLYLVNRGLIHLKFMDFSVITGVSGYVLWRTGIIGFWHKYVTPKYDKHRPEVTTSPNA